MTAGLIPATVIFVAGVPVAAYLQSLFRLLPYSQLTGWEATQQVRLSLIGWVGALGPVTLLGLAGLWLWRSKLTLLKLILIIYTIVSLIGLVTPMSVKLGLTNIRFASAATILILAMAAAEFITYISAKLSNRRWALALILLGLTLMTAPGHWRQFLARLKFDPQNAYYYLPQESLSVLEFAQKISGSHDTFLVIWPYNVSFSGITGRRQYNGHPLLTIASASKDKTAYEFFAGNLSQREMQALLVQERITYLLAYPWTFNPLPEFLQMLAGSSTLSLYRVVY